MHHVLPEGHSPSAHRAAQPQCLEPKPRLQFDYASGQTAQGPPEVGMCDDRAIVKEANRRQVKHVENVEGIGAQFEVRLFIDERQRNLLRHAHVNIEIARAAKRVALDSGLRVRRERKVSRAPARKVAARPDESLIRSVVERATVVGRGTNWTEQSSAGLPQIREELRRVRESGVSRHDGVDLEAVEDGAHGGIATAEEVRLIRSRERQEMTDVEIRITILRINVAGIGLIRFGARAFVGHVVFAFAEAVVRLKRKAVGEASGEPRVQSIVV